jgi:hypothetical protein
MRNRFFFACSVPLRIASGTSLALAQTGADVAALIADDDERRRTRSGARP